MKILLPGAGNKIIHIMNFKELKEVEKVIITDIYPWTYGGIIADSAYIVPRFNHPDFLKSIFDIYKKEKFDYIFPIHDFSLYIFSKNREYLSKMPYNVIMNDKDVVDLVSDKLETYKFFSKNKIKTPNTYIFNNFINDDIKYKFPYYIKPRYINMRGTSQQFFMKIEDLNDLKYVMNKIRLNRDKYIIQKYISGYEVNVDFFCDIYGKLQSVVSLYRQDMTKGRGISRGEIFFDNKINKIIERLSKKIKFIGPNQVQLYITEGDEYILTEINGRFSGSTILLKEAGVNYFYYFIKMIIGEKIIIREQPKKIKMNTWDVPFFYTKSFYNEL